MMQWACSPKAKRKVTNLFPSVSVGPAYYGRSIEQPVRVTSESGPIVAADFAFSQINRPGRVGSAMRIHIALFCE